jgi:tRNA U34 5-methylaminomethyl-2-thiouridine-forming methyltransferase MnmC
VRKGFQLRATTSGGVSLYSEAYNETIHPGLGPEGEAHRLYVEQSSFQEKLGESTKEDPLVLWDVGLGAGANALSAVRAWEEAPAGHLRIYSFENDLGLMEAAREAHRENPLHFSFVNHPSIEQILANSVFSAASQQGNKSLEWQLILGDFTGWIEQPRGAIQPPRLIFFDPYSPSRNWRMWRLPVWEGLYKFCREVDCEIFTYSRATGLRVTMLLAGFHVGRGEATGFKEETTVGATRLSSLKSPLPATWMETVKRSDASQPYVADSFETGPIAPEWLKKLAEHPQFL